MITQKYKSVFMLLLIPALVLFDLGVYFVTRATCFECHNVSYFIQNSSLTSAVIVDAIRSLRSA